MDHSTSSHNSSVQLRERGAATVTQGNLPAREACLAPRSGQGVSRADGEMTGVRVCIKQRLTSGISLIHSPLSFLR